MKKFFRSPIVVGILMGLLCVGAAAGIFFGLIQPTQQALQVQVDRYTPVRQYTDQPSGGQLLKTAQLSLATAQHNVAVVQTRWSVIQTTKNPPIDFSDRYKAWLEYNAEAQFDFAQRINVFLTHTGVKPLSLISPLQTISDPNMPAPKEVFPESLGQISVFGSYDQIVNHMLAWNRFSRIVVIDGLNISGYNPFLTGTYSATEYIFTNNYDSPGPGIGVGQTQAIKTNATFESVPEYHINIKNPINQSAVNGGAPAGQLGAPPQGYQGPGAGSRRLPGP
jgi:hypothetical protein